MVRMSSGSKLTGEVRQGRWNNQEMKERKRRSKRVDGANPVKMAAVPALNNQTAHGFLACLA